MPGVRSFDTAAKQKPGLLARTPGTARVLFPLFAELFDGHVDAILFETAQGAHFVIPIIIHWGAVVLLWIMIDPNSRGYLMLELQAQEHGDDLRSPDRVRPVLVVCMRKNQAPAARRRICRRNRMGK